MKIELADYEIYPNVVEAEKESSITIRPLGEHARFDDHTAYLIRFLPMEESMEGIEGCEYESITVKPDQGILCFVHTFKGEQEYYIRVIKAENTEHRIGDFHVYSLMPDLYERRPFRGDFHVHTCRSDGHESPAVVAANYRKSGFDFLAITDHHKWEPSVEAKQAYEGVPVDLKLFYGEEIHPPKNHIHMVNFGGSFSVNTLFTKDEPTYTQEVNEIIERTEIPEGVNAFEYASCVWCFDRIREAGGLGIFCHPHWIADVYHVQEKMVDFLFEKKPFDAFELLGGHEVWSNNVQTAYYNEARAKGLKIPIVGSSDSHGSENEGWFNWFSTLVFAKKPELPEIRDAVKDLYSVAVEKYQGEQYRVYGPYRLVKYAIFLLNEYFPLHDAMCFEEGRLMKEYVCGNSMALELLKLMQGRTGTLLERCFAKTE